MVKFKMVKAKDEEPTAPGQVKIRKKSKVPGVMITQYVQELPEGMSTPDFTRKPIALTIQEGKLAVFKAIVTGNPPPTVTWVRNEGPLDDPERYIMSHDSSGEHQLQMPDVSSDMADTYKCFARNEYGKAVVTAALNVIEVGFKKSKAMQQQRAEKKGNPEDYLKTLKNKVDMDEKKEEEKKEMDEAFWELIMSAEKKDYEKICQEYGVTDFRGLLKRLNEKKQEKEEEEEAKYGEKLCNVKTFALKPVELDDDELDNLPSSKVFMYKNGVMVPLEFDVSDVKHGLRQTKLFQIEVDGVKIFSTELKIPNINFLVKIQEVTAEEREDAVFQCVISHPMPKIQWQTKNTPCEQGEKFDIEVTDDMLIHTLVVKDCCQLDKGIYTAVAGMNSCSNWLIVTPEDPKNRGQKKERKTTRAGGCGEDLMKIAQEQAAKVAIEREEMAKRAKAEAEARALADAEARAKAEAEAAAAKAAKAAARAADKAAGKDVGPEEPPPVKKKKEKKKKPKAEGDGSEAPGSEGAGSEAAAAEGEAESEGEEEDDVEEGGNEGDVGQDGQDGQDGAAPVEGKKKKRVRQGPLVPETVIDPGVYITSGLSDTSAVIGTDAELVCRLSSEDCEGIWSKDGVDLTSTDDICILKEGVFHKLIIKNCKEEDSGKYRFEADGRKTEAMVTIEDPPRISPDDLAEFMKPVIIKLNQTASFELSFVGREPLKIQWYNEGEELAEESHIKIEKSETYSRLVLTKCVRKTSGEIKIKLKNECGTIEAITSLVVLDKPLTPQGPVETIEASSNCIEFAWRPPRDTGGLPITDYILERQQIGRNSKKKLGKIGPDARYKDTDVDHGRKYCYYIRAETEQGLSEMMETDDLQAGTKAYPGAPSAPKVVEAFKDCIHLSWSAPSNTGGTNILGYNLEKRKNGSNVWSMVHPANEPIKDRKFGVKDVVEGLEYEFKVAAINISGAGEYSTPSEFVFARDPKKPPGKVIDLKVTDSTYTTLSLGWSKPSEEEGVQDEAKGYLVELRPAEDPEWSSCHANPIIMCSYTIMGLKSMAMYWVRVIATNEGGNGEPQELDNYIIAMPPPVRPQFTDPKMKSIMIVRAENSARVNINFVASPVPRITWLKEGVPVTKRVTVSNSDISSQLLIPAAERSDSGVYTIVVKNIVGQETFSTEIRVTDDPKSPGPVDLEENVPGTVTVSWIPSVDEKRDDRLYYFIMKRDSVKRSWQTVADRLFNNKYTVTNIMPGRQYFFRVYAKNDMGVSEASESSPWEVEQKKEKFTLNLAFPPDCSFETAPSFTVPLKTHTSPETYECYMTCAVTGNPRPSVTWYRNNISLNTNTNYYITNTCGVCSMVILRVGSKDNGEYSVTASNALGRVECSTKLTVKD